MGLYNIKEELKDDRIVKLQWHGAPTRVLIQGDGEKTEVDTGDVIEVSVKQAAELLHYDSKWTKEGDQPVISEFDKQQKKLRDEQSKIAQKAAKDAAKRAKGESSEAAAEAGEGDDDEDDDAPIDIATLNPEAMSKDEIVLTLKKLEVTVNSRQGEEKLRELLVETINEKKAELEKAAEAGEGASE